MSSAGPQSSGGGSGGSGGLSSGSGLASVSGPGSGSVSSELLRGEGRTPSPEHLPQGLEEEIDIAHEQERREYEDNGAFDDSKQQRDNWDLLRGSQREPKQQSLHDGDRGEDHLQTTDSPSLSALPISAQQSVSPSSSSGSNVTTTKKAKPAEILIPTEEMVRARSYNELQTSPSSPKYAQLEATESSKSKDVFKYLRIEIADCFREIRKLERSFSEDSPSMKEQEARFKGLTSRFRAINNGTDYSQPVDEIARDFCDDLFMELDRDDRTHSRLLLFYDDVSTELVVQGCGYEYRGQKNVVHALLEMYKGLKIKHTVKEVIANSSGPSTFFDVLATCKCTIKIEEDSSRSVTQVACYHYDTRTACVHLPELLSDIFELQLRSDEKFSVDRLVCTKHLFIVTDSRPLYYNPEVPAISSDEEDANDRNTIDEEDTESDGDTPTSSRPTSSPFYSPTMSSKQLSARSNPSRKSRISPRPQRSFRRSGIADNSDARGDRSTIFTRGNSGHSRSSRSINSKSSSSSPKR